MEPSEEKVDSSIDMRYNLLIEDEEQSENQSTFNHENFWSMFVNYLERVKKTGNPQ